MSNTRTTTLDVTAIYYFNIGIVGLIAAILEIQTNARVALLKMAGAIVMCAGLWIVLKAPELLSDTAANPPR